MCGRFALDKDIDELVEQFVGERGFAALDGWRPSWNVKPTNLVPVLFESNRGDPEQDGESAARTPPQRGAGPAVQTGRDTTPDESDRPGAARRLGLARWGLVPPWAKELRLKYPTFNARSEGITGKPTWRGPVASKRAIIPVTGYYEWQKAGDRKIPHFIRAAEGGLLGLAGLYSWWPDPAVPEDDDRRWHLTATILTSDAVDRLVGIHDRNPVPLPADWWDTWLDAGTAGDQALVDAAVQAALPVARQLVAYPVAPLRGDGPELIHPAE